MSEIVMRQDVEKYGWKDKIGYALGDFGCNLSFVLVNTYIMVYYVTVLGVSPVHYGYIILFAKIWDGINDPLVGYLVDKFQPETGKSKFKPWMLYGSYALALVGVLMFLPITESPYWVKILLCAVSYVAWDMIYTVVNVPYGAMSSVISADPTHREELSRYRSIGSLLGNVPAGVILPYILYNQTTGDPISGRFFWMAILMGVLAWVFIQLSAYMVQERLVHVAPDKKEEIIENEDNSITPADINKVPDTKEMNKDESYFKTFIKGISSRPMFGLILATAALLMFLQSNGQTNQYVFMLYYERTDMIGMTMLANYIAQILTFLFVPKLTERFDKKNVVTYPMIGIIIVTLALWLLPVENPWIWVVGQFIIGLCSGPLVMLMWSLISDCIDYMEYKEGNRREGTVYSTVTLFRKISSGLGGMFIGFGLAATGYDQVIDVAQQAMNVGVNMKNFAAIFTLIGATIIFLSMFFIYNLNDEYIKEINVSMGRDV